MRPLIVVSTSELRRGGMMHVAEGEPPRNEMVLGLRYLQAIEAAGGAPVVAAPMAAASLAALLAHADGVCLSGGPDVDPKGYGAERHHRMGPTEPQLDAFELELVRAADARQLPILAICRGMQVLNVARGRYLAPTPPRRRRGLDHPPPAAPRARADPPGADIHREPPESDRRTSVPGQLIPSPGDRRARRGPGRDSACTRRDDRERREPRSRIRHRSAVACRGPDGPARAGLTVPGVRDRCSRSRPWRSPAGASRLSTLSRCR